MCNRARYAGEPETLWGSTGKLFDERPRDNRFEPKELRPKSRAYVIREQDGERGWDVMEWDVLSGGASWPMRAYADRIVVRCDDEVVADHPRFFGRDRTIYEASALPSIALRC